MLFLLTKASRRNTVLPETLPVAAKKSSTPMAKRGAYKQRQGRAKRARITYEKGTPDDGKMKRVLPHPLIGYRAFCYSFRVCCFVFFFCTSNFC